jgi:hypothetical protein
VSPGLIVLSRKGDEDVVEVEVELGEFVELRKEGDRYVVVFEHARVEVPEDLIRYVALYYAAPLRGFFLVGDPGDEELKLFEKDGVKYISIPSLEEGNPLVLKYEYEEYNEGFARNFNESYKAVWVKYDPYRGWEAVLSYGSSEDEAFESLMERVIDDMVEWVNREKRIDFVFEIASADPREAFRIADEYKRKGSSKPGKQVRKRRRVHR